MTDIDPEVFNNPNRGVSHLPFLDEIEAQETENHNALKEGRVPRKVKSRDRFGSDVMGPIEFEDDIPDFDETTMEEYFQNREIERVETQKKFAAEQALVEIQNDSAAEEAAITSVANNSTVSDPNNPAVVTVDPGTEVIS